MQYTGKPFLFIFFFFSVLFLNAQRVYKDHSVLSTGAWYKVAVSRAGVYKIDVAFLNSLGVNTSGLSSASVRIFGNGGQMLAEANAVPRIDDLEENAVMVVDGGDGIINGADYILFYANGPDLWLKDSANHRFLHQKNIYSDSSFYFISITGTTAGKRITTLQNSSPPAATVDNYHSRFFHELDTINFLSSGKEWYGEEFAEAPGKTLSRNFAVPLNFLSGQPVTLVAECAARSINTASAFALQINNQAAMQIAIPATSAGAYDFFARENKSEVTLVPPAGNMTIGVSYQPGSFNSQGWLNWLEIHGKSPLTFPANGQLLFRDWNSVGNTTVEFVISNAVPGLQVWDVTDPLNPFDVQGTFSGNEFRFRNDGSRLREYIAFNSNFLSPVSKGKINTQDLHETAVTDYLIITDKTLRVQAERLAEFHRQQNGLRAGVFFIDEIYNEFSSGNPDPVAVRDFVKMFYDKAVTNGTDKPRYLALLGDASFDYKNRVMGNINLVPCYQNNFSLDPLNTYTSDDFFGFLDDHEDINSGLVTNLLDIGIGRIPARSPEEAKNYVDKVIAYYDPLSFGSWRNNLTFIADDEDNNLHLDDAEVITNTVANTNRLFNTQKVYLDAFLQQTNSAGAAYPGVIDALNNKMLNGTLIYNYSGHGSARRLAEEVVLDQSVVSTWNNKYRLPLFITATCDFAPYDNPLLNSLGENILLRPGNGGIALMTTTRLVFAFSNRVINNNYLRFALARDSSGKYLSLGDAVRAAKNFTYQNSGDISNNRKFTLLGDPALTLGFPELNIRVTSVNGISPIQADTLSATEKVIVEGEVTDFSGNASSGFNGNAFISVFDKPQSASTLGNDASSLVTGFQTQTNILFKGKATVQNGKFTVEFKIPKDLDYNIGNGKMSFYAENGSKEAGGFFTDFFTGGNSLQQDNDKEGPALKAWLNDEKFVNGGITGNRPVLILHLSDSSGINTSTTGIGHDITVTMDNYNTRFYVLNDFYEADQDSYQKGKVRFQLPEMSAGEHRLHIKAWDVLNNSGEAFLDFSVVNEDELVISRVLNYPNPFTTKTQFWFEHNRQGQELRVRIRIFTLSGRIIKTLKKTIITEGNRSCEVEWDGRDEFGDKIARGVYLYELTVSAPGTKSKSTLQKLVVF